MTSPNKKKVYNDCVEGDTVSEGDTSDEECNHESSKTIPTTRSRKGLELPDGSADNDSKSRINTKKKMLFILLAIALVAGSFVGGYYIVRHQKSKQAAESGSQSAGDLSILAPNGDDMDSSVEEGVVDEQSPQESQQEDDSSSTSNSPKAIPSDEDTTEQVVDIPIMNDKPLNMVKPNNEIDAEKQSTTTVWPELVGMTGKDAKAQLESEFGEGTYKIIVLNHNSPTTRDYRTDRIRIFTDDDGVVVEAPRIG